jgi:outer membrane protein insertion porin family
MRHTLFALLVMLPFSSMAAGDFVVKDMRVEGLQRISEGTVFNYLPINIGDRVDNIRIGEAIRALYGQVRCGYQFRYSGSPKQHCPNHG